MDVQTVAPEGPAAHPAGQTIGYARVSTDEQHLDLQLAALNKAGCHRAFTDKASGTRTDREGLREAMAYLRPGDTFTVCKLDRLGRSVKGLIDLVGELAERGVPNRSQKRKHANRSQVILGESPR